MSFEHRKTRALEVLSRTGMARSHYAPPLIRLLWKAGVQVPPPHFLPFLRVALGTGLWFGMFWGLIMWIFFWSRPDAATPLSPLAALVAACAAGGLRGRQPVWHRHGQRLCPRPAQAPVAGMDRAGRATVPRQCP